MMPDPQALATQAQDAAMGAAIDAALDHAGLTPPTKPPRPSEWWIAKKAHAAKIGCPASTDPLEDATHSYIRNAQPDADESTGAAAEAAAAAALRPRGEQEPPRNFTEEAIDEEREQQKQRAILRRSSGLAAPDTSDNIEEGDPCGFCERNTGIQLVTPYYNGPSFRTHWTLNTSSTVCTPRCTTTWAMHDWIEDPTADGACPSRPHPPPLSTALRYWLCLWAGRSCVAGQDKCVHTRNSNHTAVATRPV